MHAIYEESGKFLGGRILSEADASAHIELDTGKRVKVKAANILLRFEKPSVPELLASAHTLAQTIELDLAWEFAPEGEFGFADLAVEYFGGKPDVQQQAAALMRLFEAPHYFRRAGKGRFKKAPADIIQQALAAIQKKQQLAALINEWAEQLGAGQCPTPVREQLFRILFKPDKNAPEYKAVVEAARATQLPPLTLLRQAGAIASAYDFHWNRFLFDQFPKGTGFPALDAPAASHEWPVAEGVSAFSIDDSQTTEIDDALSVRGLGSGQVVLGIHIAAPGLAFGVGSALDAVGRNRLSTVYMPGYKITMLPDSVVQAYTLQEGRLCPALSLYATFDEATLALTHTETRIERVHIAANLRHDQLDTLITEDWLTTPQPEAPDTPRAPLPDALQQLGQAQQQMAFLFRLARQLKQQREIARGKPELFNRPDYNFRLERPHTATAGDVPRGDETVVISTRQRGAPLDLIVAEAMILANSTWGQWLADCGVPGIYRSQHSMAPGMKVRMGTKALPHAGMGVKCYAWSTSPLRRYVDLVNQWQIIACVRHGTTAALAAPFKPKDADLFSIISSFDAAYSAYNAYQSGMERYWTLKYLEQQGVDHITGAVIKEGLVRADTLPLVLGVMGTNGMPRGTRLRVRLGHVDLMGLEVSGTVLEVLTPQALNTDSAAGAATEGNDLDLDSEDDDIATGGLTLALDVNDAALSADAPPSSAPVGA